MNKLYNTLKWKCYKYAPEQFHASIQIRNKRLPIQFSHEDRSKLGYLAITGGNVNAELKKILRKRNKPVLSNVTVALQTTTGEYCWIRELNCNRYDIKEKLMILKELREAAKRTPICETGIMQEYGKLVKTKEETIELLPKLKLIVI